MKVLKLIKKVLITPQQKKTWKKMVILNYKLNLR